MKYPPCPTSGKTCRFHLDGMTSTLLHAPIEYDAEGNPVSGGANTIMKEVLCSACSRIWTASQTALEWAQDVEPEWGHSQKLFTLEVDRSYTPTNLSDDFVIPATSQPFTSELGTYAVPVPDERDKQIEALQERINQLEYELARVNEQAAQLADEARMWQEMVTSQNDDEGNPF